MGAPRRRRGGVCPLSRPQDHVFRNQTVGRRSSRRGLIAAVHDGDPAEHIFRSGLRVLDEDVEVAVVVEDAGVQQFVLGLAAAASAVLGDELVVRKRPLRVLVQVFHVRVRRRAIQIEVVLLDVLAVIAFVARQAERALLEDGVLPVPESQREADGLVAVADPGKPVLVPSIRAGACVVVREVFPRRPVRAVVLAHGAPRPLAHVRAPALPVRGALVRRVQTKLLFVHDLSLPTLDGQSARAVDESGRRSRFRARKVLMLSCREFMCRGGGQRKGVRLRGIRPSNTCRIRPCLQL